MLRFFMRFGMAFAVGVTVFMLMHGLKGDFRAGALNNQSIVDTTKVGFGNETIIARIDQSGGLYFVSDNDLHALQSAGINDRVIAHVVRVAEKKRFEIEDSDGEAQVLVFVFALILGGFTYYFAGFIPTPSVGTKPVEA